MNRKNSRMSRSLKGLLMTLAAMLLSGLMWGCAGKKTTPPPVAYYSLNYEVPAFEPKPALPIALAIEQFRTVPPYDTPRIIYSNDDVSQNKYYYHQWMSRPGEMVARLLARDLMASGYFQAVMFSGDIPINHQLYGTVDEFYEQDSDSRWHAVLSVTVTLIKKDEKEMGRRFLLQKHYQKTHPLDRKNPKSLARAMSTSMADISVSIITDIYNVFDRIATKQEAL